MSGAGWRLRPAADTDLPQIQSIYAEHVLHGLASFELVPPDIAEMTKRRRTILDLGLPYLVAVSGAAGAEQVLGYAYLGPYRPRPAYRFTLEDSVYIAPGQAGRGVGSALLAALIEAATALGYRQMVAVIGDSGNTPSIRLHQRHGFRQAGLLRSTGWKHDRWVDTVLMQRALGPGDTEPGVSQASI